ncbi:MAG: hypothetical protein IPI81_13600 [Flavobacteriales bacterium]|nr:hypothetical protein [Flavobacteriales bacterium]MCC6937339.1 hypothetical protein [Flavobacteriales bacterium]
MAAKREKVTIRKKPSAEGEAMNAAFKKATKRAAEEAFKVRKTIMVEKDGWLVMVDKNGIVKRRVKRLELIRLQK